MTRTVTEALAWAGDGAAHLRGLMTRMGDDAFRAPSALPGWSRAHVLTHIARNADAMINLLKWAATGKETPAYPSAEARTADIESGSTRSPTEIREDVVASSDRLAVAVRKLPKEAWSRHITNVQGREIPVTDVPWMRAREMWVHAVDLDIGASFSDLPPPMLTELLSDVAAAMSTREGCPAMRLVADAGTWAVAEGAAPVVVTGSAPDLAAWLLGRSKGKELRADGARKLPSLPRWL